MENKEMNNAYESNEIYSSSAPQNTEALSIMNQTAGSATPEGYSRYEASQPQSGQEYTTSASSSSYPYQPYTSRSGQGYQTPYNSVPYNVMNTASQPAPKKAKKGSNKTIGLIAGTLALALCVGVGGGVLGAYLVNQNAGTQQTAGVNVTNKTENSTQSSQSSSAKKEDTTAKTDNSSTLNITKSEAQAEKTSVQEVVAAVKDAVVEITTETTEYDSFYGQYVSQAAGSGVIISTDGYILTNNHVIDGASTITVRLTNSKTYEAKLIGKDATLDIALLKIEEKDLTAATFGDSSKLNVGQDAIVIGNPLGRLGGTVTNGIISALDREIKIDGKTMNLLQTNAEINPGNSGGGLFDANGNLVGIVVAKSSSTSSGTSAEGLGFAIPVNDVMDILEDLKTKGHVTGRGNLGINIVTVNSEDAMFMYRVEKMGVYVSAVTQGSAAEKAGLQVGDLITEFNGKEISSGSELTAAVSKLKAGTKVSIKIERNGSEQTLEATLDEKEVDSTNNQSDRNAQNNYGYNGGSYFGNNGGYFGMG